MSTSSSYGPIISIIAFISRAGPDHYMVEHVDEDELIGENVLVQDSKWSGPLVVAGFVAFNASQLVAKCLGRNGSGDVIERFLIINKAHCVLPLALMQDIEVGEVLDQGRVLVTGLSEREYMTRSTPGPVLPFPHSPLPFPISFPHLSDCLTYNPLFQPDDFNNVSVTSCFSSVSSLFSSIHACFSIYHSDSYFG